MTQQTARWQGQSGRTYDYEVHLIGTTFAEKPGNYIFAAISDGRWKACYIGQTENLHDRLANHEKEPCAMRYGASHVHAHVTTGGEAVRKAEEEDLIRLHKPPCNDQLK